MKETLILPKTSFPMRADMKAKEPSIAKMWNAELVGQLKNRAKKFHLLDGPPYSNGNTHIGHALNKILKDFVIRYHYLQGCDAEYIPGWDCHGLPIENAVEANHSKDDIINFRKECRKFANKWIAKQEAQFRKFGVIANWDHKYCTMSLDYEISILQALYNILQQGLLYQDRRPILWSVSEQTALADAEVEYKEQESYSLFFKFAIDLPDTYLLAWTTTPWTLLSNQIVGYNKNFEYSKITIQHQNSNSENQGNNIAKHHQSSYICATSNINEITNIVEPESIVNIEHFDITTIKTALSPLNKKTVPVIHAEYISNEKGTGIVHMAPSHGYDDHQCAIKHNIAIHDDMMDGYSKFHDDAPVLGGSYVINPDGSNGDASDKAIAFLKKEGLFFHASKIKHPYPCSWRSGCKLIFKLTNQWFVNIDSIRVKILDNITKVKLHPNNNRLTKMMETRPNWCISRQRVWGVPIALFVHKKNRQPIIDPKLNQRILDIFNKETMDVWFTKDAQYFLGDMYDHTQYDKVTDIIEVWFDSGLAGHFINKNIDAVIEGSDQHRGWFQTLIIQNMINRGNIDIKNIVTHGFVLDKDGYKMSKSKNNVIDPLEIASSSSVDIMRLWLLSNKCSLDISVDADQKFAIDKYRKIRNVMRYLISVADFDAKFDYDNLPYLEKYILHAASVCKNNLDKAVQEYKTHEYIQILFDFCSIHLSSIYIDIRKDSIYCDSINDHKRISCTATYAKLLRFVLTYWAPVMPYTAEEIWLFLGNKQSILTSDYSGELSYINEHVALQWQSINRIRDIAFKEVERLRADGIISTSLEAHITINREPSMSAIHDDMLKNDHDNNGTEKHGNITTKNAKNGNIALSNQIHNMHQNKNDIYNIEHGNICDIKNDVAGDTKIAIANHGNCHINHYAYNAISKSEIADILIVSHVEFTDYIPENQRAHQQDSKQSEQSQCSDISGISVKKHSGNKCPRCWKMTNSDNINYICERCEKVLE